MTEVFSRPRTSRCPLSLNSSRCAVEIARKSSNGASVFTLEWCIDPGKLHFLCLLRGLQNAVPVLPYDIITLPADHRRDLRRTPVVIDLELLQRLRVYRISAGIRTRPGTHCRDSQPHRMIPEYRTLPRRQGQFHLLIQQAVSADQLDQLPVRLLYLGLQASHMG